MVNFMLGYFLGKLVCERKKRRRGGVFRTRMQTQLRVDTGR